MEPDKPKVGVLTASVMLLIAGFFDLLQFVISMFGFLPTGVTQILAIIVALPITIFAYLVFIIWFAFLNVQFFNIKKPLSFLSRTGGILLEGLPFLTALPILSTSILFTLIEANGAKGFPASLVPKFLLNMTPAGKLVNKALKGANDNTPQAANDNAKEQSRDAA